MINTDPHQQNGDAWDPRVQKLASQKEAVGENAEMERNFAGIWNPDARNSTEEEGGEE